MKNHNNLKSLTIVLIFERLNMAQILRIHRGIRPGVRTEQRDGSLVTQDPLNYERKEYGKSGSDELTKVSDGSGP